MREARDQCQDLAVPETRIRELLAPAERLLEDEDFWEHQDLGLAVLLAPETTFVRRLPIPVGELALVADRFHLKPILPLLSRRGESLALAVSQNRVRLFEGSRFSMRELDAT